METPKKGTIYVRAVSSRGALKITTLGEIAFKRAKTPNFHLKNVCGADQLPKTEKKGRVGYEIGPRLDKQAAEVHKKQMDKCDVAHEKKAVR